MFEKEIANWQQTLQNNLPVAFTAYDASKGQTDRVSCYMLDHSALQGLIDSAPQKLRLHLGLASGADFSSIPSTPYAQFYLEGLLPGSGAAVTVQMNWEPNPPFLLSGFTGPDSGVDEIPSEGALLFVMGWLETAYQDISTAFDGLNMVTNQVQRVRYYTYSADESGRIIELLKNNTNSKLYLYLGKTIPVTAHPMGFRPVLEVRIDDSAGAGGGGSHFFDFANPCPPAC